MNVAQAAELAIQKIFAVTRSEQPARYDDLSGVKLLLVEFPAANFQHDVRRDCPDRSRGRRRGDVMDGKSEDGFVIRKSDGDGVDFRAWDDDFFGFPGLSVFYCAVGLGRGTGAD